MATCRVEIQPIKAFVRETFLYDMDPTKIGFVECRLIGLTSYPGHALTWDIWIPSTGGCFAYVPFHMVTTKPDCPITHTLKSLVCRNCPDETFSVNTFQFFKEKNIRVQIRHVGPQEQDLWMDGRYLFTVDWYNQNELYLVMELPNGQFCAQPFHRLLVEGKEDKLPPYKKLRAEFKV